MTTKLASLKQGICVDMAVVSSAESIPDTQTSRQPTSSCSNHEDNCFGLPYEDHNYGVPPPPPTPPLSPNSAFITHGLNGKGCFKRIISNTMCVKAPVATSLYLEKALPNQNGLLKVDVLSEKNGTFCRNNSIGREPVVMRDVTRCICGFSHDYGHMICCDECGVWQHIDCVDIDQDHIPETYLCDRCNPRALNKERAMHLQAKKRENSSKTSELDSSDLESDDEKNKSKVSYTAIQSTPTSLTITSNRSAKKSDSVVLNRKRKLCKDESKRPGKRAHTNERKRSRSTSKSSCNDDDHVGAFTWARNLKEWSESCHDIDTNEYTPELLQAVLSSSHKSKDVNKQESIILQLQSQLAKVQQLRNRLMAMEDICISKPVVEILGSFMLSNQSEADGHNICKRPYPYVFFYNGFDGLEVTVDSRTIGNISRYVRRSCCPNCEVHHVMEDNKLHLFVYSKENICNGSEITIPFDFKYQNCLYDVECGCGKFKDCPVYKFTNMRMIREEKETSKQHKRRDDELGKVSPLRVSLSRIHEHINGYSSSDHEVLNTVECEDDDNNRLNRRKKSREDRKVEAYMRAFEMLEKKEKKKELLHQSQSNNLDEKNQISETNLLLNSASQHAVSQSLVTLNGSSPSTLLTVTPLRRPNKRAKSTRGSRRNSKRSRGASFECVLSPSLSVENDSNHSLDISSMPDAINSNSLQSLPPLTIESVSESLFFSEASISMHHSNTNSSVIAQNSDASVDSVNFSLNKTSTPLECTTNSAQFELSESIDKSLEANSTFTKKAVDSSQSTQIENNNITTTTDREKHEASIPNCESQPASSLVLKSVKKKSNSSVDTLPVANINTELSNNSSVTPASDIINKCTFNHWDFRPGIPSGQIHIGVGNYSKRKYFSKLHTKKIWLKMATDENLLTLDENISDRLDTKTINNCEGKYDNGFKKCFLKSFILSTSPDQQQLNAKPTVISETPEQNLLTEVPTDNSKSSNPVMDTNSLPPNLETRVVNQQSVLLQQFNPMNCTIATASTSVTAATSTPIVNSHTSTVLPTIQYEIPKPAAPHQKLGPSTPLRVNGELQSNRASFFQLPLQDEGSCKSLDQSTIIEDAQTAPTKKKVSLQEYLKRSKETRKSISFEQTSISTKTTVTSSDAVSSTAAEIKSYNSNPTLSSIALPSADGLQPTSQATTAITTLTSSASLKSTKSESFGKEVESLAKILSEVTRSAKIDVSHTDHLNKLTNVLSSEASILAPQVMEVVNEFMKKYPATSNASSESNKQPPASTTAETKLLGGEKSTQEINRTGSSKLSSETPVNNFLQSSTRPSVERSNSSPGVRHRSASSIANARKKKTPSESQPNSSSSKHSTPLSSSLHRKDFASPVSASPHSNRSQSTPLGSPSPLTPTIYDHRHRAEYLSRDHANESTRSRHNSNASSEGNSSHSTKSPRHVFSESSSTHYNNKHSSSSGHSLSTDDLKQSRLHEPPQKVPSLTPAVPGQPIPSLIRGSAGSRVPQTVYNRRSSPRPDGGSPRWDLHSSRDPPGRSLKDVPYSRPEPYYPPRPHSPPNNSNYEYNRSSYDKHHYDRYHPRLSRGHDDHLPSKANLPPAPYHQYSSHYQTVPPNYRDDRPGYYPPRDARPPSPGPPRHSAYSYRSSHYPPPDHYRR